MKTAWKLTLAMLPLAILGAAVPQTAIAQSVQPAPALLNFQGRLAKPDGSPVPDGPYSIRFSLWNVASGGTAANNEKWTQTISNVAVKNGVFAVIFDTTTNAVLFNTNLWLEIKVGNDAALTPRQQLLSVAQALKANTVPDFSITSNKIQNQAITADKLAPGVLGGAVGGDLTGSLPNPLLRTDPLLLTKVSGTYLNILNGVNAVDQAQNSAPSIITDYGWQSFKPTAGRLTGIDVYVGTSNGVTHIADLVIRQGIGNDKPEVARVQVTVQPTLGWQHFDLANGGIDVTNTDYTWDMGSFAPLRFGYATGNPYPNGIADIGDTLDFAFRTYLRNGTNPVISAFAPFNFTNTTQLAERLRLSGQEFFQASNTSTDGISLLLGTNRANSRQLWFGDSARLAVNSTNPILRLWLNAAGGSSLDAIATDASPQNLLLNVGGGNVGIGGTATTSRLAVNGVIESKTGGIKFPDGTVQTTAPSVNYWQGSGNNVYNTNSGNIGIGTSTPAMSLEVTRTSLYGAPALGVSASASRWLYLHGSTADHSLIWNDGSALRFGKETSKGTGYSELMRINSNGSVGIGTGSPSANTRLEVNSGGGTNTSLKLEHSGSNLVVRPFSSGGTATVVENSAGSLILNPSGSVGIGLSPGGSAKLHVRGRTYVEGDSNWGGSPTISLAVGDTDTGFNWGGDGILQFYSNGGNRAQLNGSTFNVDGNIYGDYIESEGFMYSATGFSTNGGVSAYGGYYGSVGDAITANLYNASPLVNGRSFATLRAENSSGGYAIDGVGRIVSNVKNFRIDHPLDPANKYLMHTSVESDKAQTMYNGTIRLDDNGEAWVQLPDWFEALNKDFTYQLTAIGGPGRDLYIAQEISKNRFQIAGGKPSMKVSWQVTGVRHDAFIRAYGAPVEVDKGAERGTYLYPTLYGQPQTKSAGALRAAQQPSRSGVKR